MARKNRSQQNSSGDNLDDLKGMGEEDLDFEDDEMENDDGGDILDDDDDLGLIGVWTRQHGVRQELLHARVGELAVERNHVRCRQRQLALEQRRQQIGPLREQLAEHFVQHTRHARIDLASDVPAGQIGNFREITRRLASSSDEDGLNPGHLRTDVASSRATALDLPSARGDHLRAPGTYLVDATVCAKTLWFSGVWEEARAVGQEQL